jgi:diadenosine tetraphosphate (Ap4A) HIT family hydrolase
VLLLYPGDEEKPDKNSARFSARLAIRSPMAFELDPRLASSSLPLGQLGASRVLLKNNAHFLWLLLVPEVEAEVTELHELPAELFGEVCFHTRHLSGWIKDTFDVDKVNVAAIGNIVSQLHIHVVGRYRGDIAWPGTVWACEEKKAFSDEEILHIQTSYEHEFGSP